MYVNDNIKNAFNPNGGEGGRYIDYNVRFDIIENDAQNNSEITAHEDNIISLKDTVFTNSDFFKIATFEKDGFALDGSAVVAPTIEQNHGDIGLLSKVISDENGNTDITIMLESLYPANLIASTFGFGYVYPINFELSYFDENDNLISEFEITNNAEMLYVHNFAISDVKKIIITITKISRAFSRFRLSYFLFGAIKIYDKTNSDSLNITETLDPFNERLPSNELRLLSDNFAKEFNIFDPTGIYAYFNERQLIRARIGGGEDNNLNYISMGKYFLQRPKLGGNTSKIDIKATNIFGVLSDMIYSNGFFGETSFKQLLNTVFNEFNYNFITPDWFSDKKIKTYIKTQSYSDILRKTAQATNTIIFTDKYGNIVFSEFFKETYEKHNFDYCDYKLENGFSPSDDNIINTVEVEASEFSVVNSEIEKLAEISGAGVFNVKYEPSVEHSIKVSGGSALDVKYFTDNAVLTLTGGIAEISGKKIITNKNAVSVNNRRLNDGYYIYSLKDNEFINNSNALSVAEYFLKLKAIYRRNVKVNYRGYPYIEVGDKIDFYINNGNTQDFFITKNNFNIAGGMTAALECKELPI